MAFSSGAEQIEFLNCVYTGQATRSTADFIPEGPGAAIFDSGEFLLGDFHQGKLNGKGIAFFCKGGYFKGSFSGNKAHGQGVLRLLSGTTGFLNFFNGLLDGFALWVSPVLKNQENSRKCKEKSNSSGKTQTEKTKNEELRDHKRHENTEKNPNEEEQESICQSKRKNSVEKDEENMDGSWEMRAEALRKEESRYMTPEKNQRIFGGDFEWSLRSYDNGMLCKEVSKGIGDPPFGKQPSLFRILLTPDFIQEKRLLMQTGTFQVGSSVA